MTTIRDVAREAGVAISTVSLALNGSGPVSNETRARILKAAAAVNYCPNPMAQNLRRGRTKLIGLVLGDVGNPFFGQLLRTLDRRISEVEHMLIVVDTDSHPEREIQMIDQLKRHRVAGVMITPLHNDPEFAAYLNALDMPVVLVDQDVEGCRHDFVSSDNHLAAGMLIEHLVRLGHRRIAFLGGQPHLWTANRRLEGYRLAMAAAGCNIDPALEVAADFSAEKAYYSVAKLLAGPSRPTAFLAANNLMAIGALQAVNDLGLRCPEDVSIAGIDSVPWGGVIKPRITTAEQPIEELGRVAAGWMLDRIHRPGPPTAPRRVHVAVPSLILGQSCAPPPGL